MVVVVVIEVVSSNGCESCSVGSGIRSLSVSLVVVVFMTVVVRCNPATQTPRTVSFLQSKSSYIVEVVVVVVVV